MKAKTLDVPGVAGQCPVCHHPPIHHRPDGTGATCAVCVFLAEQAVKEMAERGIFQTTVIKICTLKFQFKLSQREREQAEVADKASWPPKTVCAECDCLWEAHKGYLCPTGDSTFVPVIESKLPFLFTKEN